MKKSWIIIIIVILIIATTIIGSIIVLKLVNKGESKDNNLNGMYNENLSNDGGNDITFICSEDLYNCEGFDNQLDAQNTYDYCKKIKLLAT